MIDFKKYIDNDFKALDVIGTTSFGVVPKAIWRYTWGNEYCFPWIVPYRFRANQSTHIAITCVGFDGKKWLMEMDNTKIQQMYVSVEFNQVMLQEEYDLVKHSLSESFQKVNILSGIKMTKPEDYFAKRNFDPHVCWIGRYNGMSMDQQRNGNQWLFDRRRDGVQYDYLDILGLLAMATKKAPVVGSPDVYVCSELPQKCYGYIGILKQSIVPMTPKNWQELNIMEEVIV